MKLILRSNPRRHLMAAIVSIFFVAPLSWMILDRDPPYTVKSGFIEPKHAAPGSDVNVTWDIALKRDCYPSTKNNVTRVFTDKNGEIHVFVPVPTAFAEGGTRPEPAIAERNIDRMLVVPLMPPGPAKYHSVSCYVCNPIHEFWPVCVETPDLPLMIDEKGN